MTDRVTQLLCKLIDKWHRIVLQWIYIIEKKGIDFNIKKDGFTDVINYRVTMLLKLMQLHYFSNIITCNFTIINEKLKKNNILVFPNSNYTFSKDKFFQIVLSIPIINYSLFNFLNQWIKRFLIYNNRLKLCTFLSCPFLS